MSFKDIACHVWAIDGYENDEQANTVNTEYSKAAALLKTANNLKSKQEALEKLVRAARVSEATAKKCTIYGGFRRGQHAPEHMWLEYNGKIYETMPGYELYSEDATTASRQNPQLENEPLTYVAKVESVLTVAQERHIA